MEESYVSFNTGDEFYSWANDNMLQVKTWPSFSKDDVKEIADFSFVPQGESKEILGNKPKPAASVCVVKDGDTLFKAGYGSTSADKNVPVDPDKTIFKVASVSKIFYCSCRYKARRRG
ncbi:MAG: beta-lactamase family protein [Caldisericales bacterium]|nr:beta-lactamase family protein [Caldisericales bacterium]